MQSPHSKLLLNSWGVLSKNLSPHICLHPKEPITPAFHQHPASPESSLYVRDSNVLPLRPSPQTPYICSKTSNSPCIHQAGSGSGFSNV